MLKFLYVNGRKEEQEIAESCNRLIKNYIQPPLWKMLLYSVQLVTLNFEHLHNVLNGFFFRDSM